MKQVVREDVIYVDLGQHPKHKIISEVGDVPEDSEVMEKIDAAIRLQLGLVVSI